MTERVAVTTRFLESVPSVLVIEVEAGVLTLYPESWQLNKGGIDLTVSRIEIAQIGRGRYMAALYVLFDDQSHDEEPDSGEVLDTESYGNSPEIAFWVAVEGYGNRLTAPAARVREARAAKAARALLGGITMTNEMLPVKGVRQ